MKNLYLIPVLALGLAGAASAQGPGLLLINEVRIDMPGSDVEEYFELFSVPASASLDGLTYLVIGDGTGASGTIEAVVDLTGSSTNALGLFVAAEASFTLSAADLVTSLNFENSDNVTHMVVDGFTGANGDDLDTDDDGVLDVTPWTSVIDAISLVETVVPDLLSSQEHYYGPSLGFNAVGPDGSFVPGQVFRCLTSLTDWRIGDFGTGTTDSPGAFNAACSATTSAFCDPGAMNSVSALGGLLGFDGSGSVQVNNNALVATDVPNFFGVFVQADMMGGPVTSPIGGELCLAGTPQRMNVIVQAAGNQATLALDFTDPLLVESSTMAGVTVYYQFFHRDTVFPGGGNWTNGLAVTWAP